MPPGFVKLYGLAHHEPSIGLVFVAADSCLEIPVEPRKTLSDEQAAFYHDSPFYQVSTELHFTATRLILASLASSNITTQYPRPFVSILAEFPPDSSNSFFLRTFASHSAINSRAFSLHQVDESRSALENWLIAEDELLNPESWPIVYVGG
ncbi:hypothetical protein DTL42_19625 [Bremerella cremea]|uniref:Uncharacterized protein n=1 Tax=Bremerella cremea TaxID=1031537 RepID=A0A368KP43_9BACT|nr:hypothetical protein [Bremerella cremea]RCS42042.1 hypothetical protein DTL42_19625 [Bremerella cremea]